MFECVMHHNHNHFLEEEENTNGGSGEKDIESNKNDLTANGKVSQIELVEVKSSASLKEIKDSLKSKHINF